MTYIDKKYNTLSHLWASGIRDYHNLTSGYLTAISILIASTSLIMRIESTTNDKYIVSSLFAFIGIILCIQMAVAQHRFSAQNAYWERSLRVLEMQSKETEQKIFLELYRFREEGQTLPCLKIGDEYENEFTPNWGIMNHRKWWAKRMKIIPALFIIIYIVLIYWNMIQLK